MIGKNDASKELGPENGMEASEATAIVLLRQKPRWKTIGSLK